MQRIILVALALAAAVGCTASDPDAGSVDAAAARQCRDGDRDGYTAASCGGTDCNDKNRNVNPGAAEVCGDRVDNDCDGTVDESCASGGGGATSHAGLTWSGYGMCRTCHAAEASEVHASGHYQWMGSAPFNVNDPSTRQGKLQNSINSYCMSTLGNWDGIDASGTGACSACHVGRGLQPAATASAEQLDNIDCLVCHQDGYRRKKNPATGLFEPDAAAMTITMDQAVRTVHRPTRASCLQCHAKAGGGDAVKRGDLALAHAATGDGSYDVHMATTRGNLACQACHTVQNHRIAGSGVDLRVVDLNVQMTCTQCHASKGTSTGHATAAVNTHVARVACQTCHIPRYGRNASDTAATEATETHRTWLSTHATTPPYHPASTKANDLTPRYAFWNGYANVGLLHDTPAKDPATGAYPTSRPVGGINDRASKLYPFKYKTAEAPFAPNRGKIVAIDTSVFFATASPDAAVKQGLVNMGYTATEPYTWVTTDAYQLLTHTVAPKASALACTTCHENTTQLDLRALGYARKAELTVICAQCHSGGAYRGFADTHDRHVRSERYDCSWCHAFSRPERGLTLPR